MEIKDLGQSEVEIIGEINADDFASFRPAALERLSGRYNIEGFRPGHVPPQIIEQKIGNDKILSEMAELALSKHYPRILADNKIDALGQPTIILTKLATDNPLGFKIKTAVFPKIDLPDYKMLAGKESTLDIIQPITEQEIDEAIKKLSTRTPEMGGPNQNEIPDFRTKVKEALEQEKVRQAHDKRRVKTLEAIRTTTKIVLPPVLINSELHKMLAEFKGEIKAMGLEYTDYLKRIEKTEEQLLVDWKEMAIKRVEISLILDAIARAEKIEPDAMRMEEEVKRFTTAHPDVAEEKIRTYLSEILTNEAVIAFLEEQKVS